MSSWTWVTCYYWLGSSFRIVWFNPFKSTTVLALTEARWKLETRQVHVWITTNNVFSFYNNEFDEILCKLDSTEYSRSFQILPENTRVHEMHTQTTNKCWQSVYDDHPNSNPFRTRLGLWRRGKQKDLVGGWERSWVRRQMHSVVIVVSPLVRYC